MNTPLHLITCPTCLGLGCTANSSGTIECLTCQGRGIWLETETGQQLFYPIPTFQAITALPSFPYQKWLRYGLAGVSGSVLLIATAAIIVEAGISPSDFLWRAGIANFLFGLSGLGSIYSLSTLQSRRDTINSLLSLNLSGNLPEPINLKSYANSRVKTLLEELPRVANDLHQTQVDAAVLFIALLRQQHIQLIMTRLEISTTEVEKAALQLLQEATTQPITSVSYSTEARQSIYEGILESFEHDLPYIDIEDIFLALSKKEPFKDLLNWFKITDKEIYTVSRWIASEETSSQRANMLIKQGRGRAKGYMNKAWTALPTPVLDSYSLDITRQASVGNTQIITVHEAEIQSTLQILGRTQKNNVLLLGEPGTGKESIMEAIATRMLEEDVPEILKDKRLVKLDTSSLLSDPNQAGQNIQMILDETAQAGNVILIIPEIQTLVGGSGQSLDAATLLSGALNKGWIQIITTSTYGGYHKYVESNQVLASLLEIVEVKEPSIEQTITVLEEEVGQIRYRQNVWITYPAIEAAATLAKRYLPEKVLPASAIDLIDEVSSSVHMAGRQLVMKKDVEEVLEKKTGIPIQEADEHESTLLLNLEAELHKRIVGQVDAIATVSGAMRRARAGLHDGKRPISSFLFVGPTGVGKTETAKALAALYFGNEEAIMRLDMSEYQDNQSIYQLIGAPATDSGGSTGGGTLTQHIREHPFSLILLDEIEKAAPEVLNLFLQIFDDGRVTENTGRTVRFNNTIIIATSNAGTSEVLQLLQQGLSINETPKQILRILADHFKPEFLNRFDAIIPFHPLSAPEIEQITTLMLQSVINKLAERNYQISFGHSVIQKLATEGFDPLYGARPLRRIVQDKVEGGLAEMILRKTLIPGQPLQIEADMI